MRITHVTWTFTFGGIETMLVNIANEQVNLGHEVHIVVIEHNNVESTLREKLHSSIALHYAERKYGMKDILAILRLNRILSSVNPDVIHLHSSAIYKYLLPHLRKICNDTLHDMCNSSNTNYINRIPKVFAISEAVAEDLVKKKGVCSIVNPNGIRPELIRIRQESKKDQIFRIVQVSRLAHEKKGQDLLLMAIRELLNRGFDKLELTFIGDGESSGYLQELSKEYQIANQVLFLGSKSQQYIFEHLSDYDLFVQPSRYEGFGLTVAEAMAAKVPVIVSSGQGPEEIVAHGECGYVFENGNAYSLADKIEVFLKDENDRSMVEKAFTRVWNLYNIKVTVKSYLEHYIRKQ